MDSEQTTEHEEQIVVDVSWWTMGEHEDWINEVHVEKNISGMREMMSEIVLSWPFEGNPSDPDAYRALSAQDWLSVVKAVGDAIAAAFQRPSDRVDQRNKVRKARHRRS